MLVPTNAIVSGIFVNYFIYYPQYQAYYTTATHWMGFCYPQDRLLLPTGWIFATRRTGFCYPLDGFLLPTGQASATHWTGFFYTLDGFLLLLPTGPGYIMVWNCFHVKQCMLAITN